MAREATPPTTRPALPDPWNGVDMYRWTERLSARQNLLYVAACFRQAWHLLGGDARAVVDAAESLADGRVSHAEFVATYQRLGPERVGKLELHDVVQLLDGVVLQLAEGMRC